jgi:hypothetical protein
MFGLSSSNKQRIEALERQMERATTWLAQLERDFRLSEREKLTLKPSRKPRGPIVYTAPQCVYVSDVGRNCPRHTKDASGYCKPHRILLFDANGLAVQSTP